MDETGFAWLQVSDIEDVRPDGEDCLRQGRRLDEAQALGDRQGMTGVGAGILGIAAARKQGGDRIALAPAQRALPDLSHLAGDLQTHGLGRARRRRIVAQPLEHVGAVHPGRLHRDQDLPGTGLGPRDMDDLEGVRRALAAPDPHGGHGLGHDLVSALACALRPWGV